MRNVLIVDDERSFLLSLVEGLSVYAADFNTLTAVNGKEAVDVLRSRNVDLVVTDLKMPEMDGFQLLAYMSKEYPQIPMIVMTAYCTPEIKQRIEDLGSFRLLEKPLNFKDLVDSIFAELAGKSKGYIRGITMPTFLQLVEMEKKTCTLKISSEGKSGFLYFSEGILMDADNGTDTGEKAAYDIVSWNEPEIEIDNVCKIKTKNIESSLIYILMESCRIKDETDKQEGGGPEKMRGIADESAGSAVDVSVSRSYQDGSVAVLSKKEEKMDSLKDILNEFAKLQGVNAVCLVGRDGFLLDSIARSGIETEMVGAIASSGFGSAESMGRQLGKGELSMSMLEFESGPVMFSPVGEDAFLVVVADKEANLGMVRLKLKKYCHQLATVAAL
jgi:predicted regulator of Ras-like GTPase activity (Roadblock/LC7/MglB family)/ActR/RegA family two-component response regulator